MKQEEEEEEEEEDVSINQFESAMRKQFSSLPSAAVPCSCLFFSPPLSLSLSLLLLVVVVILLLLLGTAPTHHTPSA